jgi:hypothetical protein
MSPAVPSPPTPIPVVYIGGWGRAGSTLLEAILHELPGFFSVGELRTIWTEWDDARSVVCTCGASADKCAVWSLVLGNVFERLGITWQDAKAIHDHEGRTRHLPTAMSLRWRRTSTSDYQELMLSIYQEVLDVTGASTVVDSSKAGTEALLLADLPALVDLRIVHLVRDPRATAYAWTKTVVDPTLSQGVMPRFNSVTSTFYWVLQNQLLEYAGRQAAGYHLLRYEDLMDRPQDALAAVCEFVGADSECIPLVETHSVRLGERHVLAGNPKRGRIGVVPLIRDDEWMKVGANAPTRLASFVLTPLARKYGYAAK